MDQIHLGLDLRLWGHKDSGLGRYNSSLLESLLTIEASQLKLSALVGSESMARQLSERGIATKVISVRPYSWAEQKMLPRAIGELGVDCMHFPHFNMPWRCPVPYVVTAHDLILHHLPSRHASQRVAVLYWVKYVAYRVLFRHAIKRATAVIAISNYTAVDLLTYYPWLKNRITTILQPRPELEGVPCLPPDKISVLPYTISSPFVLVVGNFYPHKNIERLLDAWPRVYDATGWHLVLVGRGDAFQARCQQRAEKKGLMAAPQVIFAENVNDTVLAMLYEHAHAYLCVSLFEGAGLPGLEALQRGCPVISSAETALPETLGRAAIYIPIKTDHQISQALIQIIKFKLPPRGFQKNIMTRPSLEDCGAALLAIYNRTHVNHKKN